MKGGGIRGRLERLEGRMMAKPDGDTGVDMRSPLDPFQVAILEELETYTPLEGKPCEAFSEITEVCVGRALVNADLSAEVVEELAPAYRALFNSYFEEIERKRGEG